MSHTKMPTIRELHDLYLGAQDAYDAGAMAEAPRAGLLLQHCVVPLAAGGRRRLELTPSNSSGKLGEGAAGVTLRGDWTLARLIIGGMRVEFIQPFMGVDGFWATSGGRALPVLRYHYAEVEVEVGEGGATLEWDTVALAEAVPNEGLEYYTLQVQHAGEDVASAVTASPLLNERVRLSFNHPVFALYVKTDVPVRSMRLTLDANGEHALTWDPVRERWQLIFQPIERYGAPHSSATTVNFSRVDRACLLIERDQDAKHADCRVLTWVVTGHVARIHNGQFGLRFTK